jgi:hypothetical protein
MNLAVKLYGEIEVGLKPTGIPDEWPAEIIELGESEDLPDETWVLMTVSNYATYRANHISEYVTWASTYYATPQLTIVSTRIAQAMNFGRSLIIRYASENVLMGITASGKTKAVADCLQQLSYYISSGSLYQAISQIDTLISDGLDESLSPFITEARLNTYKAMIVAFLTS